MRKRPIITTLSHELIKPYITKDDILIDATMGHGHDTIFLSTIAKKVYAFDIQKEAILSTREKVLNMHIENVELILDSHEHILNYVKDFKGVVFNLGYLPNGNKRITTNQDITIKTLDALLPHLPYQGFISIVVYPGHEKGYLESIALDAYLKTLDIEAYHIVRVDLPYQNNQPPYIMMIINEKKDVR